MTRAVGIIFHGIGTPPANVAAGDQPFWITPARFRDILDRIAAAPERYVLTFDDGNLSDHEIALPELAARGLHAHFFILSGRIGQPGYLDATQIRALAEAGMTVGSHGIDHLAWSGLDDAALWRELTGSRDRLEEICGRPVTEAGIPFGSYTARVLRMLRRAGYTAAYTSDTGPMRREAFLRHRSSIRADMGPEALDAVLAGRSPALRRRIGMARRRWLPIR